MKSTTTSPETTKRNAPVPSDRKQETALRLWIVLARAFNSVSHHITEDIEHNGLTLMEFGILEVLHHKGRLTLGEIRQDRV
jgi:MarR family 2-MHQ and catechol resistance regulon transcriptional repressor